MAGKQKRPVGLENPADEVNGVGLSNLGQPPALTPRGRVLARGDKSQVGPQDNDRSEKGSRRRGRSATDRRADEGESIGLGRGG
jgi:hypothetical protein